MKSNVEELSARDATILAISPQDFPLADDFIKTKFSNHPMAEFFESDGYCATFSSRDIHKIWVMM